MIGRASRFALDPAVLVAFLESRSEYKTGGHPVRTRRYINGVPVDDNDARIIRRWSGGSIKGVTRNAAHSLLERHRLSLTEHVAWAEAVAGRQPVLRGRF